MNDARPACLGGSLLLSLSLLAGVLFVPLPASVAADLTESSPGSAGSGRVTSIVPPPIAVVERMRTGELATPPLRLFRASSAVQPRRLTGAVNLLAILVDFSDHPATVTSLTQFDNLVFAPQVVGRGSVRDYYADVSHGQVDLVTVNLPSTTGWQRAPQTYAYYVNSQYGWGAYPQNAGRMVEDILPYVDPLVDFSNYDNDGDGAVDTLLVIHAGTGAEFSQNTGDVWSHASSISMMGGSPSIYDGVLVDRYVTVPEGLDFLTPAVTATSTDMTIGVIAHEIAHGLFGLVDLYDLDLSSNGIGQWGLMSYGNWNGPSIWDPYISQWVTGGSSPALPSAWSRIVAGLDTYYMAFGPVDSTCLPPVETSPAGMIYRFKSTGVEPQEYFLVENRQKLTGGYDEYLPASGLLIWHVDEAQWAIYGGPNNDSECTSTPHCWGSCASTHYLVALEQADGLDGLENGTNRGDGGDPFPGSTNNTAWQWYGHSAVNPESGSWHDSSCVRDSCIDITTIYNQLSNVCFTVQQGSCAADEADLGDAPASQNNHSLSMTAYPASGILSAVPANFPTVYWPGTGPTAPRHHFAQVDAWLGATVSGEAQADVGPDQDGSPNIDPPTDTPDQDSVGSSRGFDDGLPWLVHLAHCTAVTLPYTVTVGSTAVFPRYVNVWGDWNRDGDWGDTLSCPGVSAPEWAVQDQVLSLAQGTHSLITPSFVPQVVIAEDAVFGTWLRISIADMPAPSPHDGRGPSMGYDLGETEDYHLELFPSLEVTASLSGTPAAGDIITYHIRCGGDGNVVAQGVVISDVLPSGLEYVSSSPPGTYNPAARTAFWTVDLVPNQYTTIDLVTRMAGQPCSTITNTAHILWANTIWKRTSLGFEARCRNVYLPAVVKSYSP